MDIQRLGVTPQESKETPGVSRHELTSNLSCSRKDPESRSINDGHSCTDSVVVKGSKLGLTPLLDPPRVRAVKPCHVHILCKARGCKHLLGSLSITENLDARSNPKGHCENMHLGGYVVL